MTVSLGHPDAQDPINEAAQEHRTSPSSGHSTSAIFNIHSFNIGDISQVSPDTHIDFKAYKLSKIAGGGYGQELVGSCQLQVAQMRLKNFGEKVRKSLGLAKPGKM